MLRIGAQRPELRVVDDQWDTPTIAADLAEAISTVTLRLVDDPIAPTGTFHFCSSGETTWYRFAQKIFRLSAAMGGRNLS
jgi:dTDP-4-dehydrorhamnose reductase